MKIEHDGVKVYLLVDGGTLEMSREEAEGLFVVLGHTLQDMDLMKKEHDSEEI